MYALIIMDVKSHHYLRTYYIKIKNKNSVGIFGRKKCEWWFWRFVLYDPILHPNAKPMSTIEMLTKYYGK